MANVLWRISEELGSGPLASISTFHLKSPIPGGELSVHMALGKSQPRPLQVMHAHAHLPHVNRHYLTLFRGCLREFHNQTALLTSLPGFLYRHSYIRNSTVSHENALHLKCYKCISHTMTQMTGDLSTPRSTRMTSQVGGHCSAGTAQYRATAKYYTQVIM